MGFETVKPTDQTIELSAGKFLRSFAQLSAALKHDIPLLIHRQVISYLLSYFCFKISSDHKNPQYNPSYTVTSANFIIKTCKKHVQAIHSKECIPYVVLYAYC